jgi:2-(1,2-epoxy-1,2-dihydrophenyl)acetyl-CoA isomerase
VSANRVEAVRRFYRALAAGDRELLLDAIAPDFVGIVADGMPNALGGRYAGADAMLRDCWTPLYTAIDVEAVPDEFLETRDGRIVTLGHYVGTARLTGKPLSAAFAHILRIDGHRVSELVQYTDTKRWNDAAAVMS